MQKNFYSKKAKNILIISTSKKYFQKIEGALKFIQKFDDKSFKKINKYLKTIFIVDKVKFFNELFTKEYIWMSGYKIFIDVSYDKKYIASLLLHEAHHITQYLAGHKNTGLKAEKKAYFVQIKFLKKIKYHTAIKWLDKQYKNKWWKSMDKDKKSADHFRKLLEDYQKKKLKIKKLKDIKL